MLTTRIIKLLGIAGVAVLAAAWLAAREQRREEEERRRLDERLEKDRWESEGGASRSGPPPRAPSPRTDIAGGGRIRATGSAPVFFRCPVFAVSAWRPFGRRGVRLGALLHHQDGIERLPDLVAVEGLLEPHEELAPDVGLLQRVDLHAGADGDAGSGP